MTGHDPQAATRELAPPPDARADGPLPTAAAAVLFDLDGTLVDTAPDMARALNDLRAEEGRAPLGYEVIRPHVSNGAAALLRLAFPDAAGEAFEALRQRYLAIYRRQVCVESVVYAGLARALDGIEARGIGWGVVTNKPGWLTEPLLRALGLYERAAVVVSGDTLAVRKPDPAPLLHAARALAVRADRCLYVGDALRDVEAARDAGMWGLVALYGYRLPGEEPRGWPAAAWFETSVALGAYLDSLAPP